MMFKSYTLEIQRHMEVKIKGKKIHDSVVGDSTCTLLNAYAQE